MVKDDEKGENKVHILLIRRVDGNEREFCRFFFLCRCAWCKQQQQGIFDGKEINLPDRFNFRFYMFFFGLASDLLPSVLVGNTFDEYLLTATPSRQEVEITGLLAFQISFTKGNFM